MMQAMSQDREQHVWPVSRRCCTEKELMLRWLGQMKCTVVLALVLAGLLAAAPASAQTTVTNTNDSGPGSLREAINAANAASGPNTVSFNIPGPGPHIINLSTPLPPLLGNNDSIDGTTQPGASCGDLWAGTPPNLLINLNAGAIGPGLHLEAASLTVRGLSITGFVNKVYVHPFASNVSLRCNYIGLYPDGMLEHDGHVGLFLDKLKELGIDDNTIVVYSTDNGAETGSWPDGGITPFHGEKGTTWEGGFRVPQVVRWPGVIKPGTIYNQMMSHEDWLPTFLHAAGVPNIVEKCKAGYQANGKTWKVHLDGYDYLPFFKGEVDKAPRDSIYYFGQGGELNAVRWNDWKVHFAIVKGNITVNRYFMTIVQISQKFLDDYKETYF